jgi:hypothetical protein
MENRRSPTVFEGGDRVTRFYHASMLSLRWLGSTNVGDIQHRMPERTGYLARAIRRLGDIDVRHPL